MDVSDASQRRKFFLSRARRSVGASLLHVLEHLPAPFEVRDVHVDLFGDVPAMLVGAHAAAAYAPARNTADVDFLVPHERFHDATRTLATHGFEKVGDLRFAMSHLERYESTWTRRSSRESIDVISSPAGWVVEAFVAPETRDPSQRRVIALPYLVLMKIDASRAIDQGDLARMLGKLNPVDVGDVVAIVTRHLTDSTLADDLVQYAEIGRWEYGVDVSPGDDRSRAWSVETQHP